MSGQDPTDQALAVIASIFEQPAKPNATEREAIKPDADQSDAGAAEPAAGEGARSCRCTPVFPGVASAVLCVS